MASLVRRVALAALLGVAVGCATSTGESPREGSSEHCATARDCALPAAACLVAVCQAGVCMTRNAPKGTLVASSAVDECSVTIDECDATGGVATRVAPVAVGAPCTSGGRRCDGAGRCVACVDARDCAEGYSCGADYACAPPLCKNRVKDATESDVDCGGTCPRWDAGAACTADSDCKSNACDPLAHVCITTTCRDGRKDGDETGVDCGGSCAMCAVGAACAIDYDCASNACDAFTFLCVADQCQNNRQDDRESDVDCGGGICAQCSVGLGCQINFDCASNACDTVLNRCVRDQCQDHRQDGNESDVDCGGFYCRGCSAAAAASDRSARTDSIAPEVCTVTAKRPRATIT